MIPDSSNAIGRYRGRIAPSPTGHLHLGHARTFWVAQERARQQGGVLILRNENLDSDRCRAEFEADMIQDLRWFGLEWAEGPDCGGGFGPYVQKERLPLYEAAFHSLRARGLVYACRCSRRDVQQALQAPHAGDEEPVYPGTCRPPSNSSATPHYFVSNPVGEKISWRFRVPDGDSISFLDGAAGPKSYLAGRDFGDFVVWRQDGLPSYQLAVVVDDAAMQITEVVRGRDLLLSTARQLLLYRALGLAAPRFVHCPLMLDAQGVRLAKRHDSLSLRHLRELGRTPAELRQSGMFCAPESGDSFLKI